MAFGNLCLHHVEQLLDLQPGDVGLALRGLHSVLQVLAVSSYPIVVHHASFRDFLDDPARSGVFCVRGFQQRKDLAGFILKALTINSVYDASATHGISPLAWCVTLPCD
jgi:hypothetical protein